jgi:hypothetical protein
MSDKSPDGRRSYRLSGGAIKRLMRNRGLTISGVAAKWSITRKRVREVRAEGVTGFMAENWFHMLTGQWPFKD